MVVIKIFDNRYDTDTMSAGMKSMLKARVKVALKDSDRKMEEAFKKLDGSKVEYITMYQAKLNDILKLL